MTRPTMTDAKFEQTDRQMLERCKCPLPGIYADIPAVEYFAWDALSNSRMNWLRRSPRHLRHAIDNPPPSTPAMLLGTATHTAILEPDRFDESYARNIVGDGKTKAVKDARAALLAKGKLVLTATDFDSVIGMRDSVTQNASANALLSGDGQVELSIVWIDPDTGVRCKARIDRLSPHIDGGAMVDLKTTRDASPRAFERAVYTFGYHRQGAFYLMGAAALGMPVRHYAIAAVEKGAPYAVKVMRLNEVAIEAGEDQIRPMLELFKKCSDDNTWPAYGDDIADVFLPDYAWSQIQNESETR